MTIRIRHLVMLCVAFAALVLPAVAQATPDDVLRDCAADGTLDDEHSNADKREALKRMPADLDEYSDCQAAIAAAIGGAGKARASRNGDGGAGGVGTASTKAERAQRKAQAERRQKKRQATEMALGDRKIDPRNPDVFRALDTSNGLPTPVLLALIALGLLGAAGGALALGKRNQGMTAMLRRVSLPFLRR